MSGTIECIQYTKKKAPGLMERDFEDVVEECLGGCGWRTWRAERAAGAGFGTAQADYDRTLALKVESLVGFVKDTQSAEWAKVEGLYGPRATAEFLKRACAALEPHDDRGGLLNTLRRGFKMAPGASFKLCYFEPEGDLNPGAVRLWRANRFEVVRQLRFGTLKGVDEDDSVDVVLFVNGIPLVTMELKNNLTGQSTADAERQYMLDRPTKELLFKPNRRALVHFALDSETASMCTWLKGKESKFLPFNRGNGMAGGGNPPNPNGLRTEYLYQQILSPSSLMDIVERFARVEYSKDDEKATGKAKAATNVKAMKAVIFPRYHQLDAVRQLARTARAEGPGHSYLVQHSAGSGKSNTIAWLAQELANLHGESGGNVFDTVVVLTDRKVLDSQLADTVEAANGVKGVVVRIREEDGSAGLRDALNSGARVVTSTIQKFPYICSQTKVLGRRFAVIIDEAHSSQTGTSHAKMKMALAECDDDGQDGEPEDGQDRLARELAAQGPVPNISFFAFTATPKQATLEVFGTRDELCSEDANGRPIPRAFHLYSMKQAIEEGYILDVLESYTVYEQYYKLAKTIQNDPRYKGSKANPALLSIAVNDPHTVTKKAAIIVEHFASEVAHGLDCRAKAMVVTHSRPAAYRLWRAIRDYAESKGYDLAPMVAFSGTLSVDGADVTEASLNGVPESQTAAEFDRDAHRVIVCANKYQTGFDQPKLCAMYVDKMLTGVAAVQTLSRLNRCAPGKFTRVVDFVNDWETIRASFSTYYEATELDAVTDPSVVYDIRERLDGFRVYEQAEVDAVADLYYGPEDRMLQRVEALLQPAADRWRVLEAGERLTFKGLLHKFVRVHSFVGQMVKLGDPELARFAAYAALLVRKLHVTAEPLDDLRGQVALEYMRLQEMGTRSIELDSQALHNGASNAGARTEEDKELLSELVAHMNELFGTDWTDADKVFRACEEKLMEDEGFLAQCRSNSMGDVAAVFGDVMMKALAAIMSESAEMAEAFSKNQAAANELLNTYLLPSVYRKANGGR